MRFTGFSLEELRDIAHDFTYTTQCIPDISLEQLERPIYVDKKYKRKKYHRVSTIVGLPTGKFNW